MAAFRVAETKAKTGPTRFLGMSTKTMLIALDREDEMETPIHIPNGEEDADPVDADVLALDASANQAYVGATTAVIAALQADKGLTVAEINKYLPAVKDAISNLGFVVPGAGNVIAGILKVLPNQI